MPMFTINTLSITPSSNTMTKTRILLCRGRGKLRNLLHVVNVIVKEQLSTRLLDSLDQQLLTAVTTQQQLPQMSFYLSLEIFSR